MLVPQRARAKLAGKVAARIATDVVEMGWPVGDVLGSEAELVARYGVSRAVFREAVRILEQQHVARTRRGPGGGLVIAEPTVEATTDATVLYLHRVDARLDEVFEARLVLEEIVAGLAPARIDEADVERLRSIVRQEASGEIKDHRALHAALASMTRNPALELFVDILNWVSTLYLSDPRTIEARTFAASGHAHARIAEAVIAGNESLARHRMCKHLEAEAAFLQARRSSRKLLPRTPPSGAPGSKRADTVARRILLRILVDKLEPGDLVGSEPELIARYDVSRAVFREAVRLLEHHHIAAMRRGPGGGLVVTPPSVGAVTDVVALYLARRTISLGDLVELRLAVEPVLADLAADRAEANDAETLRQAAEHHDVAGDPEPAEIVHDLHAAVARVAGNRVLELVALVLIRLSRLYQVERAPRSANDEVRRAHAGIAAAVAAGDRDLARHRMRRHLEGFAAFVQ